MVLFEQVNGLIWGMLALAIKQLNHKRGHVMGLWRRLFALHDPLDDLLGSTMSSIQRSATLLTAPEDREPRKLATERKGHISLKAVEDEYERLILEKYRHR
jgi:hypothetical protein